MKYLKSFDKSPQKDEYLGLHEDRTIDWLKLPEYCEQITKAEHTKRTNKNRPNTWSKLGSSDPTPFDPVDFSKFEIRKLENIFKTWKDRRMDKYEIDGNHVYIEHGGRSFGQEINIRKFTEDWYFIDVIPRDAWTFATRNHKEYEYYRTFYRADRFDTVLKFLKQFDFNGNDKKVFKAFKNQ